MVWKLLFAPGIAMEGLFMSPNPKCTNHNDILHYFEYSSSGLEVIEDGLSELPFGEYLVERDILDRFQLLRALQMQDRNPGVRLGECAAALGYAPIQQIERAYREFASLQTVLVA